MEVVPPEVALVPPVAELVEDVIVWDVIVWDVIVLTDFVPFVLVVIVLVARMSVARFAHRTWLVTALAAIDLKDLHEALHLAYPQIYMAI